MLLSFETTMYHKSQSHKESFFWSLWIIESVQNTVETLDLSSPSPRQRLFGAFSLSYMTFPQILKFTDDHGKLKFKDCPRRENIISDIWNFHYTSCYTVEVDQNKNKKRKHNPHIRRSDCNTPLRNKRIRAPKGTTFFYTLCKAILNRIATKRN